MTVITLGTSLTLVLCCHRPNVRITVYRYVSQSRHCKVKLSALKSIVNKLSCPKCQMEFLKGPVANVADLFNSSIKADDFYSRHIFYAYIHLFVCCVLITVSTIFVIE